MAIAVSLVAGLALTADGGEGRPVAKGGKAAQASGAAPSEYVTRYKDRLAASEQWTASVKATLMQRLTEASRSEAEAPHGRVALTLNFDREGVAHDPKAGGFSENAAFTKLALKVAAETKFPPPPAQLFKTPGSSLRVVLDVSAVKNVHAGSTIEEWDAFVSQQLMRRWRELVERQVREHPGSLGRGRVEVSYDVTADGTIEHPIVVGDAPQGGLGIVALETFLGVKLPPPPAGSLTGGALTRKIKFETR